MSFPLRPFKVLFTNYYPTANFNCKPFPQLHRSKRCPYPGLSAELFGLLAKDLNVEIVPSVITTGEGNRDSNAEAVGSAYYNYKQSILNETDTHAVLFQVIGNRQALFDFTVQIYPVQAILYVHREDYLKTNWWTMFRVYDILTWKIIIFLLVAQCVFIGFAHFTEYKLGYHQKLEVSEIIWKTIRLQCFQPEIFNFKFTAGYVSISIYAFLQCSIVFGIFASYLLSSMIIINKDSMVQNPEYLLQEMKEGKRQIITLQKDAWLENMIHHSDDTPYSSIRKASNNASFIRAKNLKDSLYQMRHRGSLLYLLSEDRVNTLVTMHCDIVPASFKFQVKHARIMLRKNHPLTGALNMSIKRNWREIYNIYKSYLNVEKSKASICNEYKLGDPMSLRPYIGVLVFMAIINTVALITFICEIVYKKCFYYPKEWRRYNKNMIVIEI